MVEELRGKKLLVFGGSADEISLVERAKELGVYVVVTDYFCEEWRTPAKKVADEAWDNDWTKTDLLAEKCREHHIDGVLAGYSEIKVDYMIRLCHELSLPCYITPEQLEITRDKIKFKEACRRNGVPTIKEYASVEAVDEYPVIVKPVDRGGSIGISVAKNRSELDAAYEYAMEMSLTKRVIIEKYISARKIDISYVIEDGNIELVSSDDTIMAQSNNGEKVVQSSWVYPHREEKNFLFTQDANLRKMIKNVGLQYGAIFFSGFCDEHGEYAFFECGFRLGGGHDDEYVFRRGKMNVLDIFICHSLTGNTQLVKRNTVQRPQLKLATINFYAKKGVVSQIKGEQCIMKMPDCTYFQVSAYIGENCGTDKAILSKLGMCSFANEDSEKLVEDIQSAYATFKVLDEDGNDMVYDRIDCSIIKDWWA